MDVFSVLKDGKTYGLCALGLALIGAVALGWIYLDPKLLEELKSALVFGAIAALRAGVAKSGVAK